jgi:hypothetical protein
MSFDLREHHRLEEESSLEYWYPLVKDFLPTPKTEIVPITFDYTVALLEHEQPPTEVHDRVKEAANKIGYPVFIRTDQASSKHDYALSCIAHNDDELEVRAFKTIEHNECVGFGGLPYRSLVIREYLPLVSCFKAFNQLPIAVERRYFVRDGRVECHHPYWCTEAVQQDMDRRQWAANITGMPADIPENWLQKLIHMNIEHHEEVAVLIDAAKTFGEHVPGYWSVDFALVNGRGWMLIDAARGEISWHPEDCPFNKEAER